MAFSDWYLSDWLIWSGPVTYISAWVIILIMLVMFEFSDAMKVALITYAIMPVGAISQTGSGYVLACFGL